MPLYVLFVIASDLPDKAWQAGAWQSPAPPRLLRLTEVSLANIVRLFKVVLLVAPNVVVRPFRVVPIARG